LFADVIHSANSALVKRNRRLSGNTIVTFVTQPSSNRGERNNRQIVTAQFVKRELTRSHARQMVAIRETKRAALTASVR
jgi:hypothetical protein